MLGSIELNCYAPNHKRSKKEIKQMWESHKRQTLVSYILSTFRWVETGTNKGNYKAQGGSKEFGAYQFTPATWKALCLKYFGELLDINIPNNQDRVAQARIHHLIEQNFTIKQIASIWNCGSPNYENKTGVNKYGIKYDVPKYVSNFITCFDKINLN